MNKYKLINLILLTASLLTLVFIFGYWELFCKNGNCSFNLMVIILSPLTQVSFSLSIILGVFIFLPPHFFEKWLKWIFSWVFPLYLILIYMLGDTNGGFFVTITFAMVAQFLGIVFGVFSLVFVLALYVMGNLKKI